ncbi:MAG: hypothetical protein H5T74_11840 [Actinobacteria bacterium]|nr:hypothetical protein [Actinomycetota bacterium]
MMPAPSSPGSASIPRRGGSWRSWRRGCAGRRTALRDDAGPEFAWERIDPAKRRELEELAESLRWTEDGPPG